MAIQDVAFFAKYYHDFDLFPMQPKWSDFLDHTDRGGILAWPGSGKTELVARFKVEQLICRNRNLRILLISETEKLAFKNSDLIRADLETNSKLIADFGSFKTRRFPWTQKYFTVARTANQKDFTVEVAGIGSSVIGSRFDIVIFDDPVSTKTVQNADIRAALVEYIQNVIATRLPREGGILWFIGSPQHPKDIYRYFDEHPFYDVEKTPALLEYPDHYDIIELEHPELDDSTDPPRWVKWRCIIDPKGKQGKSSDPINWPVERLLLKKKELGTVAFNRLFQFILTDDETALIAWDFLTQCRDEEFSYYQFDQKDYIAIIGGVDPSLVQSKQEAERKNSDFAVICTFGIRENHHIDLIGLREERGFTPDQKEKWVVREARIFGYDHLFFETNNFGQIYFWNLLKKTKIPLHPHHTGGNKFDPFEGFPALEPLFENKHVRIPYQNEKDQQLTDRLYDQLYNPVEAEHDDMLAAFWIAYRGVLQYLAMLARIEERRGKASRKRTRTESSGQDQSRGSEQSDSAVHQTGRRRTARVRPRRRKATQPQED